MNKEQYIKLHTRMWKGTFECNNNELIEYLDFVQSLYELGVIFKDPQVSIDLYHADYLVLEKARNFNL